MNNYLSELTVVIVTYETEFDILKNCLKSIDPKVKIILVENSKSLKYEKEIQNSFSNVEVVCSGSNLGMGSGNNLGFSKVKTKPKIIIFDEPSTGLDIRASHKLDYLIRESVKNENITAITITHDMNSALHIADSIAMLHEGKLIWSGKPSELKKSNHAEVRRFIKPFLTSI